MSGYKKGNKGGIGKFGAKRHRKFLHDNIQGLTKPAFQRLAQQAGVKSMNGYMYEELRGVTKFHLESILKNAVARVEHDRRKTLLLRDILNAVEDEGNHMAFSHAMKNAVSACKK